MFGWPKSFTFIFIPHSNSRSKSITINGIALLVLGAAGGLIITLVVILAFFGVFSNPYAIYRQINNYKEQVTELEAEVDEHQKWKHISESLAEEVKKTRKRHRAVIQLTGLGEALNIDFSGAELKSEDFKELDNAQQILADSSQQNDRLAEIEEFLSDRTSVLTQTPLIWPTEGWVSSGYGYRQHPMGGKDEGQSFHKGIDIAAWPGTTIRSTARGTVSFAGRRTGYGKTVQVKHEFGFSTLYAHLKSIQVSEGETVQQGDVVGSVGSTGQATGAHLHYEVRVNDKVIDPTPYLVEDFNFYSEYTPREAPFHAGN